MALCSVVSMADKMDMMRVGAMDKMKVGEMVAKLGSLRVVMMGTSLADGWVWWWVGLTVIA